MDRLVKISRTLRRDRELAFYETDDLTPTEFYKMDDASQAFADTEWVYLTCKEAMGFRL